MSYFENHKEDRNTLWVEHYRPKVLTEYVGNEIVKETIQQYLDSNDIPHLLFYGKPGTGKTHFA